MAEKAQEWFRLNEAAAYLSVSTRTVQRAVRNGVLRPTGEGRRARYRRSDLDAMIAKWGTQRRACG